VETVWRGGARHAPRAALFPWISDDLPERVLAPQRSYRRILVTVGIRRERGFRSVILHVRISVTL